MIEIRRSQIFTSVIDFSRSLIARGGGAVFAFVANILLARQLGTEAFGSYITLLSAALAVGGLASYGTGPLLTREISANPVIRQAHMVKLVGLWALKRTGLLSLVGMAIVLAWLKTGIGAPSTDWSEQVATLIVIPASMALTLATSALGGLSKVALSQAANNIVKNGLLLGGAWALISMGVHSPGAALWLQAMTTVVTLFVALRWLKIFMPWSDTDLKRSNTLKVSDAVSELGWRRSAAHFFAVSASLLVLSRLDVVVVSAFANSKQAGLFGAAARIAQLAGLAGTLWIAWLQPRISMQFASNQSEKVTASLKMGLIGSVTLTALVVAVGWLVAPDLINLMGAAFRPAVWPLRCLLASYLAWSFCVPHYVFLSMSGHEGKLAKLLWIQSVVTLTMTAPMAHYFGANGAAVAWFAGTAMASISMVRMGKRTIGVRAQASGSEGRLVG